MISFIFSIYEDINIMYLQYLQYTIRSVKKYDNGMLLFKNKNVKMSTHWLQT